MNERLSVIDKQLYLKNWLCHSVSRKTLFLTEQRIHDATLTSFTSDLLELATCRLSIMFQNDHRESAENLATICL